jgi:modulator of FtsH protease
LASGINRAILETMTLQSANFDTNCPRSGSRHGEAIMNAAKDWTDFLVAEVGASAALAGLLFVAISINVAKILEYQSTVTRAAEALLLLLSVLFACTFALTPGQPDRALGLELLGVGVILGSTTLTLQIRQKSTGQPRWWLWNRILVCQVASVSYCVPGILLLSHHPAGMYWFLPACLFCFIGGLIGAWVLLIEILR